MQSKTREQPFFKPLTNRDNSQTFELNQSQSWQRQVSRHDDTSLMQSRQMQQEFVSGEKFTSLHAKLYHETDKIRKWRNQAEYDLKEKDKKIIEGNHTIESLRKSILELQLQNENLSLKLHEEINNREEIMHRVNATRDLCSLLKDHSAQNEEKLFVCKTKESELRYLEKEHVKQYEELSSRFQALTGEMKENQDKLKIEISMLKEAKLRSEEDFKKALTETERELKRLLEVCDDKDIEIRDIRSEIHGNIEKIHTQNIKIDKLNEQLTSSQTVCANTEKKLKELQADYDAAKAVQKSVERQLEKKQSELETAFNLNSQLEQELKTMNELHIQEIKALQTQLEETKQDLKITKTRIQFMETDLERANALIEETKSSKDMLMLEKTELDDKLREVEKENSYLLSQKEEHCSTLKQLSDNMNILQEKFTSSQQESAALQLQLSNLNAKLVDTENMRSASEHNVKTLENRILELQSFIENLQTERAQGLQQLRDLTAELGKMESTVKEECEKHENTKSELKKTRKTLMQYEKDLGMKTKEFAKQAKEHGTLTEKCNTLQGQLQDSLTCQEKLREELETMRTDLKLQEELKESLLQQKQTNDHSLHGKIESSTKVISDLEAKNKTLKGDLSSKNKQVKELEKELKGLKSKVASTTKSLDHKCVELEQKQKELDLHMEEKQVHQERIKEYEKTIEKEREAVKQSQQEALEMKSLAASSVQEKENMFKNCEKQRAEMNSIIENYKTESDRIVEQKNKEIEALVQQVSKAKEMQHNEKLLQLQKEVDLLRKRISESGSQMEHLQKSYGLKENQVQELEKENSKKEEELKELQEQLEHLFIKKTTSITVQTSPAPDKYGKTAQRSVSTGSTPNPALPQTPMAQTFSFEDARKTPNSMKTPQRSILKSLSSYSASKKRKVVFASKNEEKHANSDEDSSSYELMELEDGIENRDVNISTPLLLKPSPKVRTPKQGRENEDREQIKSPLVPLHRSQRGPSVDLKAKKEKKKRTSKKDVDKYILEETHDRILDHGSFKFESKTAVRKTPNRNGGKFFKSSPKDRFSRPKGKEESWFDLDDVFGFVTED